MKKISVIPELVTFLWSWSILLFWKPTQSFLEDNTAVWTSHNILVCLYSIILLSGIYLKDHTLVLQTAHALGTQPKNPILRGWFSQWQHFHSLENYQLKSDHSEVCHQQRNYANSKVKWKKKAIKNRTQILFIIF